jgi:signal transduction histidine kinase
MTVGVESEVGPLWAYLLLPVLYLLLIASLLASLFHRAVRLVQGVTALYLAVGMLAWPATENYASGRPEPFLLYYLVTVAVAMAAVAFSATLATVFLLAVSIGMTVVRVNAGTVSLVEGLIDLAYVLILGGAVVAIVTMLRRAAESVDRAQSTALETYSRAIRQHATEVERVQVDAIVHDSVLTTLLAAARAGSEEERTLAASMAAQAIGHLRQAVLAGPYAGATVSVAALAARIADAADAMSADFDVRTKSIGSRAIPASAAEAVYSAAVQAMLNSVQHAGNAPRLRRWLGIQGVQPNGIEVEVGDNGLGFNTADVPGERLGLRVSIIERVSTAGGQARVSTSPGAGTVITIRWPRVRGDQVEGDFS